MKRAPSAHGSDSRSASAAAPMGETGRRFFDELRHRQATSWIERLHKAANQTFSGAIVSAGYPPAKVRLVVG
jgi:hypothetical protein